VFPRNEVPHRAVGGHHGQVRSVNADEGVNSGPNNSCPVSGLSWEVGRVCPYPPPASRSIPMFLWRFSFRAVRIP
jgi:hypothetical protein